MVSASPSPSLILVFCLILLWHRVLSWRFGTAGRGAPATRDRGSRCKAWKTSAGARANGYRIVDTPDTRARVAREQSPATTSACARNRLYPARLPSLTASHTPILTPRDFGPMLVPGIAPARMPHVPATSLPHAHVTPCTRIAHSIRRGESQRGVGTQAHAGTWAPSLRNDLLFFGFLVGILKHFFSVRTCSVARPPATCLGATAATREPLKALREEAKPATEAVDAVMAAMLRAVNRGVGGLDGTFNVLGTSSRQKRRCGGA